MSANWTRAVPNSETACPVQIVKKRRAQFPARGGLSMAMIFLERGDIAYNRRYPDIPQPTTVGFFHDELTFPLTSLHGV
jgi:hypothetical protein